MNKPCLSGWQPDKPPKVADAPRPVRISVLATTAESPAPFQPEPLPVLSRHSCHDYVDDFGVGAEAGLHVERIEELHRLRIAYVGERDDRAELQDSDRQTRSPCPACGPNQGQQVGSAFILQANCRCSPQPESDDASSSEAMSAERRFDARALAVKVNGSDVSSLEETSISWPMIGPLRLRVNLESREGE
jgi:hypothetical protein